MLDWEWYDDINTKVLFIHLLIKSNWKEKKWRGIKKVVDNLVDVDSDLCFHVFDRNKLFSACIVRGRTNLSKNIFDKIVSLDG